MGPAPSHAVELTQRLIRCPSVTPHEGGALDCLEGELTALGFVCQAFRPLCLPVGDCLRLPFRCVGRGLFARAIGAALLEEPLSV